MSVTILNIKYNQHLTFKFMAYNPTFVRKGIYKLKDGKSKSKNLILIHGRTGDNDFNKQDDHMRSFYEAIEKGPEVKEFNVWALTYNTSFIPFYASATWLHDELKLLRDYDFRDAIVVGYSMGGLIGRALTCVGFEYKYLITINTPHHGPVSGLTIGSWLMDVASFIITPLDLLNNWIDLLSPGTDSLRWGSPDQLLIHSNEIDKQKRLTNYAFYAIDYKKSDSISFAGDDSTVPIHSQLGLEAGDVRWRYLYKKEYSSNEPEPKGNEPHTIATHPEFCKEAIKLLKTLLMGEPMPSLGLNDIPSSTKASTYEKPTEKLPIDLSNFVCYYFFDNKNKAYLKFRLTIENKDDKPVEVNLDNIIIDSNVGRFTSNETTQKIVLTPKAKRDVILKRDLGASGLLPKELDTVIIGNAVKVPIIYVPLKLAPKSKVPTSSIWEIKTENCKAINTTTSGNYFETISLELEINNDTDFIFELHQWSIIARIDSSPEDGRLAADAHWGVDAKYHILEANSKKKIPFKVNFFDKVSQKPKTITIIIGCDFIPATTLTLDIS